MDVLDVSQVTGLTVEMVGVAILRGELKAAKLGGGDFEIDRDDVLAWLGRKVERDAE